MQLPMELTDLYGPRLSAQLEWERLSAASNIFCAVGPPLSPPPEVEAYGDRAAVLVGLDHDFYEEADAVVDFAREVLQFAEWGPWSWRQQFFVGRTRSFFATDARAAPGTVLLLPYRFPIWDRAGDLGISVAPAVVHEVWTVSEQQQIKHKPVRLGFGLGEMDREERKHWELGYRSEGPRRDLKLVCIEHKLVYAWDLEIHEVVQNMFTLAHQGFDASALAQAKNPALEERYHPACGIVSTAQVLWAKLREVGDVLDMRVDVRGGDAVTDGMTTQIRPLDIFRMDRGNQLAVGFGLERVVRRPRREGPGHWWG